MSKARVAWGFQEVIASSTLNQANTDWITKAQLIFSAATAIDDTVDGSPAPVRIVLPTFNPFPYNPAKNVADRMRVIGRVQWDTSAGGNPVLALEYTIDSGVGWAGVPLVTAIPAAVQPVLAYAAGGTVGPGYTDIDISGVVATHWFNWRIILAGGLIGGNAWLAYSLSAYLFNSVDTPH